MKILFAIDESPCTAVATRAVVRQFPASGAEIRVLHAVDWPTGLPPHLTFAEGPTAARDVLDARSRMLEHGQTLVDAVALALNQAGFHATTEVRLGAARDAILAAATEWQPDLIILGSHGRRGLARVFHGSVSEQIVHRAPCSVEVVRMPQNAHDEPATNHINA